MNRIAITIIDADYWDRVEVENLLCGYYGSEARGCITEGRLPNVIIASPEGVTWSMYEQDCPTVDSQTFIQEA